MLCKGEGEGFDGARAVGDTVQLAHAHVMHVQCVTCTCDAAMCNGVQRRRGCGHQRRVVQGHDGAAGADDDDADDDDAEVASCAHA